MRKVFTAIILFTWLSFIAQTTPVFTVEANEVKGTIQPTMWGIFLEDINMAADGGVYAELVENRSFEFATRFMGWKELKKKMAMDQPQVVDAPPVGTITPPGKL